MTAITALVIGDTFYIAISFTFLCQKCNGPVVHKTSPLIQTKMRPSLKPIARKLVPLSSSGPTLRGTMTRTQSNKETKSKPVQGSDGGLRDAGLEKAKQGLLEMVILRTKTKDLFTGLRRPAQPSRLGFAYQNLMDVRSQRGACSILFLKNDCQLKRSRDSENKEA